MRVAQQKRQQVEEQEQEQRPREAPASDRPNGHPPANGRRPPSASAPPPSPPSPPPDPTIASTAHCRFCFDTLAAHLCGRPLPRPSDAFGEATCALFVTWNKRAGGLKQHRRPHEDPPGRRSSGKAQQAQRQQQQQNHHDRHHHRRSKTATAAYHLRGCIGTLEPRTALRQALRDYALTSALRDHRFDPIGAGEVPALKVTVSLLRLFERAAHPEDWRVGTHGIIVAFAEPAPPGARPAASAAPPPSLRRSATFLPEVAGEQGWTQRQAVEAAVRKSGYSGVLTPELMASLQVTRYQSTRWEMTYGEWRRGARAASAAGAGVAGAAGVAGGDLVAAMEQQQQQQLLLQQQGSGPLLRALRRLLRGPPPPQDDDYDDDFEDEDEDD